MDNVAIYIRQIRKYPLLGPDEEKRLMASIVRGRGAIERLSRREITPQEYTQIEREAAEARERMINSNLRLVVNIAAKHPDQTSLNDMINDGNIGLIRAIETFNPEQSFKFSTYAAWWIKQGIRRMKHFNKMVRVPAYMTELITRYWEAKRQFVEMHGVLPTVVELAAILKVHESTVLHTQQAILASSGLSQEPDEDEEELSEKIPDKQTFQHDENLRVQVNEILPLIDGLSDREAKVLRLYFGLDDGIPQTLQEIGNVLHLTRERIRQIKDDAIHKIRIYRTSCFRKNLETFCDITKILS